MSFPISGCMCMSLLFSRLSFFKKQPVVEIDLKKKREFSEGKASLFETIYSITMNLFSEKEAKQSLDDIKTFEERLKNVRNLEKSTLALNEVIDRLGYLDLEYKDSSEKKAADLIDHLDLDVKRSSPETLYQNLRKATQEHLRKGLEYLKAPLNIIALPESQSILKDNKVRLPESTHLIFDHALKGIFPKFLKKLNAGAFSEVASVAIGKSILAYKKVVAGELALKRQLKEACVYMLLKQHCNIVTIKAIAPEGLYLSQEDGDLIDLTEHRLLLPEELKDCFQQIASALLHIHNFGLIYKDLKLENILFRKIAGRIRIFLCDYELTTSSEDDRMQSGTAPYAAPEIWMDKVPYSQKVDAWGLGIVMCYLIMKKHPFVDSDNEQVIAMNVAHRINKACKVEGLFDKLDEVMKDRIFVDFAKRSYSEKRLRYAASNIFKLFMRIAAGCLHGDPKKRSSMENVLEELDKIYC